VSIHINAHRDAIRIYWIIRVRYVVIDMAIMQQLSDGSAKAVLLQRELNHDHHNAQSHQGS
jgi:hypothetical protein